MKKAEINNIRVLKGTIEIANYKRQEITEYANNPFIEALPPIFSDREIANKFYNIPVFEEEDRYKDKKLRFHLLKRIKNYKQVLPMHLNLEAKLSTLIRRGYIARNPREFDYFKRIEYINDLKDCKELTYKDIDNKMENMSSTAECLTMIGISGMGKTTAIERLLLMYPQVIIHTNYNDQHFTRTQIVWLKIDCPYDGNLATLFKSFFKSIDDILGTKYLEKYGYSNRVTSSMMLSMTQLASLYGIGVLVIDELQQLVNTKNSMDEMLDFFVTLSNTVGIPTVLIGTAKAQEIFNKNFRRARRAASNGCIMWDRMDINDKYWKAFIGRLWKMQCLQNYTELTDKLYKVFYEETQGITALAINLFILAQEKAIVDKDEKITTKLLRETSENDLKMLQPMLKAIKRNNLKDIAKYDDISFYFETISNNNLQNMDLYGRIQEEFEDAKSSIENKQRNRNENLFVELRTLSIFHFLTDKELRSIIKNEIETNSITLEYNEIKEVCIRKAMNKNDKNRDKQEAKNELIKIGNNELLAIHEEAMKDKKHPNEVLEKQGYIKNSKELY